MGFMDDLLSITKDDSCKFARWLDTIADDYRAEILQAISEGFPSKTIWRVIIQREGKIFSDSALFRHMKGECSCGIQG